MTTSPTSINCVGSYNFSQFQIFRQTNLRSSNNTLASHCQWTSIQCQFSKTTIIRTAFLSAWPLDNFKLSHTTVRQNRNVCPIDWTGNAHLSNFKRIDLQRRSHSGKRSLSVCLEPMVTTGYWMSCRCNGGFDGAVGSCLTLACFWWLHFITSDEISTVPIQISSSH